VWDFEDKLWILEAPVGFEVSFWAPESVCYFMFKDKTGTSWKYPFAVTDAGYRNGTNNSPGFTD